MTEDDILQEIRATRDAFATAHNYDLRAMSETLKKMDLKGRKVVSFESVSATPGGESTPPLPPKASSAA